jgi:Ca2+-dependent lipid-binding protein
MGKPKASLSCTPLFKHGLNIMHLPIISSFVQTSVDAAMANYVAPKSLTLDIKDIFKADDSKKDTNAYGVAVVHIKRAIGFKKGYTDFLGLKKDSSDPYVSVGWAKFGKSVWSTRVIMSEMEPIWDETGFIPIGPVELNAQERLSEISITLQLCVRGLTCTLAGLQLWDSAQSAADGDLGFIDIGLNEVMQNPHTNGRMWDRRDRLYKLGTKGDVPCTLDWSLGYYPKRRITPTQLAPQSNDKGIENIDDLKNMIAEGAAKKFGEARRDESHEIEQQKTQELKVKIIEPKLISFYSFDSPQAREDEIITSSPPSPDYPSGIFAIQIHQILDLGFKKTKRIQGDGVCEDDDQVEGDDLLSSYCTVILNHQRILKTRTKPKSAKPFVCLFSL